MSIRSLGYLRLRSPEPGKWLAFGRDVVGMSPTESPLHDAVALRIDEHPARLTIVPGNDAGVDAIGFEVRDEHELAAVERAVEADGSHVHRGGVEDADQRNVRAFIACDDPLGVPLEIYYGPARVHTPLTTGHVSGFVTGELGMGHVVLGGEHATEAERFYRELLGFQVRNTMRIKEPDGTRGERRMSFMGCNPRHHTVALIETPTAPQLIHFMIEVNTIDDVGRAHDRALDHRIPQRLTLGRHTNDQMVSFYSYTPDDHTIEVGCDGLLVTADETVYEITETSYWGHRKTQ